MTGRVLVGRLTAVAAAGLISTSCDGEILRGVLVFGHEVRTLQPCGSDSIFWVRAPADVLDELQGRHHDLTAEPYQTVYVELEGARSLDPTQGFAEQYDGYVDVGDIRSIARGTPAWCEVGNSSVAAIRGLTDLSLLMGTWEGELEYLDYQDDAMRVTLPVRLTVRWSEGDTAFALAYTYGEPDGSRVDRRELLRFGSDGRVWLDGWWEPTAAGLDRARGSAELTLIRQGLDNERPATIRRRILVQPGRLTMSMEVRYGGSDAYLTRNIYSLTLSAGRRPAG